MTKFLIDFQLSNGNHESAMLSADTHGEARRVAEQLLGNRAIVTNIMAWSDAVLATINPDEEWR